MNLLTPDQAAALLAERGVAAPPDTVRNWLARGRFPDAIHLPGRRGLWLIPRASVEAFAATYQRDPRGRKRR